MGLVNIFSRLELGYKWDWLQHPKYWCISGLVKCLVIMISGCNIFLVCGSPTPPHSQFTTSSAAWQYSLFLFFNSSIFLVNKRKVCPINNSPQHLKKHFR
jgi:hypothetical protein